MSEILKRDFNLHKKNIERRFKHKKLVKRCVDDILYMFCDTSEHNIKRLGVKNKDTNFVSFEVPQHPETDYLQSGYVNMDDIRLLCCIWRQTHNITYAELGRLIGVSGTWASNFERGYGLCEKPYANNILRLLTIIGYPVGMARAMTRELYLDRIGHSNYWYMEHAIDFAIHCALLDASLDSSIVDNVMSNIRYNDLVRVGERTIESTLLTKDDCPLRKMNSKPISFLYKNVESIMIPHCARCRDNHKCDRSFVKNRGMGVGRILSDAYSDDRIEIEDYIEPKTGKDKFRVVSRRFHKILDDNAGKGYSRLDMNYKAIQELLDRCQKTDR